MEFQSKYVTPDEFKEYSGIDLAANLKDDDNPSNKVNSLLYRVEARMEAFLNANFYRNVEQEYPKFTDYQKLHYKLALMEQLLYMLKSGDLSTDSGYDPDDGVKASPETIRKLVIAPNAKDQLMLCGLWCRKVISKSRGGFGDGWLY